MSTSSTTSSTTSSIRDIKTVFICPDHNEKYNKRKDHMVNLLTNIGIKNFSHYKSETESFPQCLSKALIYILEENMNDEPILILEDDVDWTGQHTLTFSSNIDALYLGLSKSGGHKTENVDDGPSTFEDFSSSQVKVVNMLATHAIVYISEKYKRAVVSVLKEHLKTHFGEHMDVPITRIQNEFLVLAEKNPFFYQSSGLGNTYLVEYLTKFCITTKTAFIFSPI